jgi:hypothetical protein
MNIHPTFKAKTRAILWLAGFWMFSSCTIALPEFQTAESLAPQQHKIAAGGYSGRGLNASTGGLLVLISGITERLDLTSHIGSFAAQF